MKKFTLAALLVLAALVGLAAFSHRILPPDVDECQRDVSHAGHVAELPLFHCIGHSEREADTGAWDHVHPWMTDEWVRAQDVPE